ncbi:hypothetical protein SRHO_G00158940 [Serrasalmus rhombeus]
MAEDGGNICEDHRGREAEGRSSLPRTFIRLNDLSGGGERNDDEPDEGAERRESAAGTVAEEAASASGGEALPYPSLAPVVFFYMKQTTRPRSWCLKMVCNPYPFIPNPNSVSPSPDAEGRGVTRVPERTPVKVGSTVGAAPDQVFENGKVIRALAFI